MDTAKIIGQKLTVGALTLFSTFTLLATASSSPVRAQFQNPQAPQARALYQRALQDFAAKNYAGCAEYCKQSEKLDPHDKNVFHLCALCYSETGDFYNANIQFRAALSLDYNFIECHNNYGIFYNKKGEPEEAKKQFKECIRLNPSYAKAYYNLGNTLQKQADLDGAVENYRTAVRLDPNYFDAQRDLGLVLFEKFEKGDAGEISEALDKLLIAARLVPDNPMIHFHLGHIYCANGDLDQGEAELREALMNDVNLAAGHFELGQLRYLRGDPNRALFEAKAAQKINPLIADAKKYPALDRIKTKELQAKCEELTENYTEAEATWKDVASLTANNAITKKHIAEVAKLSRQGSRRGKNEADPAEVKSLISKGITQTNSGDIEGAKASFNQAMQMDPKNFIPIQNLGLLYESEKDLGQAVPLYQQALDLKPRYDGLYYNMAYVLEQMNRRAEAGSWYRRFHELAGRYPYDPKHIVSLQQEDARVRAQQK